MVKRIKPRFSRKGFTPTFENGTGVLEILQQQAANFLFPTARWFIDNYQQVEPVSDAVDTIGDKIGEIVPVLQKDITDEFIFKHELLDLLKKPNKNKTYFQFMKAASNFFIITGNCYWLISRSPVRNKILELFVLPPQQITYMLGSDGYVATYNYSPQGRTIRFERQDDLMQFRYFTDDGRHELLHLKDFNPRSLLYFVEGLSRLQGSVLSILQYKAGSIHNYSLLENGTRPSGMLKVNPQATLPQMKALRAELENMFTGSTNAGRTMIANSNMVEDFISFMTNNRDMDFATLKKEVKENIYQRLKIPLVLINTDAATFNNYKTAVLALYDDAVLPQYRQIMNFLMDNFRNYFDGLEDINLFFDEMDIPALRERRVDDLKSVQTLTVLTDNEIRNKLGLKGYKGGNDIWKPTNQAPVSELLEGDNDDSNDDSNDNDSNTNDDNDNDDDND